MKLHHVRPICRASNRFSPSIALYQHFVAPYNRLQQQRFSSSVPAPVPEESAPPPIPTEDSIPPESGSYTEEIKDDSPQAEAALGVSRIKMWPMKRSGQEREKKNNARKSNEAIISQRLVDQTMLKSRLAFDEGEEYKGVVIRPIKAEIIVPEMEYPWASKFEQTDGKANGMNRLNEEIERFYMYAKPSRAETFSRKNLIEQIRADVRKHFPNYILEVFGSERTGLALATSDIDFRLVRHEETDAASWSDRPPQADERRDLLRDLYTFRYRVFGGGSKAASRYLLPTLRHARYPLLTLQDRASGIDVQIVLSNNTAKSREYMHRYMTQYPYICSVYTVLRVMLDQRGLSDVFRGGFGSYPLFMMLVASLQMKKNTRGDAAGALVNFLQYWGLFKTRRHGVSIEPPEYFNKKKHPVLTDTAAAKIAEGTQQPLPDWMLCLRDPADPTNDLGRKGICILHLQATIRSLVRGLVHRIDVNQRPSLLAPLIGDIYARDKNRRYKLARNGLWVEEQVRAASAEAVLQVTSQLANEEVQAEEEDERDVHRFLEADADDGAASESGVDDFGEVVTSTLGMPSAAEFDGAPQEQDVKTP